MLDTIDEIEERFDAEINTHFFNHARKQLEDNYEIVRLQEVNEGEFLKKLI